MLRAYIRAWLPKSEIADRVEARHSAGHRGGEDGRRQASHQLPSLHILGVRRSPQPARRFLTTLSQLGAYPRDQLAMAEWSDQIVVGPGFQPAHPVLFRISRNQQNHGQRRPPAQVREQFETTRSAQVHVQQNEVGLPILKQPQSRGAVVCGDRLEP
jgi:hypothetical protein